MKIDDRPEYAKRLEKARLSRGFKTAREAASYFGWSYDTYVQHENGLRGIGRAASKYAKAYRVGEGWLLTGEGRSPDDETSANVRIIPIKGFVQAGAWAETWELPEDDQYQVPIQADQSLSRFRLYGAETRGPSMNRRFSEGTVLIFTDMVETGEQILVGKQYIVERERADGLREATVKTLWRDDAGVFWLLPESDDPRFQQPIRVDGSEGDTIRIIGRVRYAVSKL